MYLATCRADDFLMNGGKRIDKWKIKRDVHVTRLIKTDLRFKACEKQKRMWQRPNSSSVSGRLSSGMPHVHIFIVHVFHPDQQPLFAVADWTGFEDH